MRYRSTASRLREELSDLVDGLANLVQALPIREFQRESDFLVFVGRSDFCFGEPSSAQRAIQVELKRRYETASELLKILLSRGPDDLVGRLKEADTTFRDWLELNGNWSVTSDSAENARKVRESAKLFERILSVLDVVSDDEIIVVPDTNSLLSSAEPTEYRTVIGQNSFVFMLLPTVLGELDRLKVFHPNSDVREKARQVITRVKGWRKQGSLSTGVTVDKSILVKASHSEPDMNRTLSWLDAENKDDRIIASILALQGAYPAAHVILVSGDINIMNKADAALIETIEGP